MDRVDNAIIYGYGRLVLRHHAWWDSSWRDVPTERLVITSIATIRDEAGNNVVVQADETVLVRSGS
jgi:hypothetical protein